MKLSMGVETGKWVGQYGLMELWPQSKGKYCSYAATKEGSFIKIALVVLHVTIGQRKSNNDSSYQIARFNGVMCKGCLVG